MASEIQIIQNFVYVADLLGGALVPSSDLAARVRQRVTLAPTIEGFIVNYNCPLTRTRRAPVAKPRHLGA